MALKVSDWITLLCVCVVGVQYSYQFTAEMRDIMNNCPRDGGFCINVIPPAPPRRRQRMQRRKGTRTRKGQRRGSNKPKPDPLSLAQQHTRLPAAAGGGTAAPTNTAPQQLQQQQTANRPFSFFDNLFGPTSANDPFASFFGMSMLMRKKRQAPLDPGEIAEIPRIRRGENMWNFLNTHCRKSEFDFGCRNQGGMCCLPHLK